MKSPQISKRSLPVLVALGLVLATAADAVSARPGRVSIPRPRALPRAVPTAKATAPLKAVPKRYSGTKARALPKGGTPVVVPRYIPRPLVRAGTAAVILRGTQVVTEAAPSAVVTAAEPVAVPGSEFSHAKAYQVTSVADDYTLTLSIDGRQTPVRLLGVDPLLVAAAEGQPGTMPEEALQFVRNLLLGEPVYLEPDAGLATTDADGIRVAYLYRAPDGLLVNLEIIRQGYGLAAEGYSFQHKETFAAYQSRAQQIGKGIWRGQKGTPPGN